MDDIYQTGIRPAIDAYLLSKSHQDYPDYWRASSAGYCHRYVILKRLGVPAVPERDEDLARTTRVFEAGHIFHEWLQRITKASGLSIASEAEVKDDTLHVIGHFDDLILNDKGLILYDYKTQHSKAFSYDRGMSHTHKMQLATYMYMLRKSEYYKNSLPGADTRKLSEARILKVSKDDLRLKEEQLLWTPDLEKQVVEYWSTLNGYWEKKMLPKCTCDQFDGGWFARRTKAGKIYNDYFFNGEPCSEEWITKHDLKGFTS